MTKEMRMSHGEYSFGIGDWIVHIHYGVGQIKRIEKKILNDSEVSYYKVMTKNSVYWIPVDQLDSERLRPISTEDELRQALNILSRPPREMDSDHNNRKRRIKRIHAEGTLISMARLVRDLWARRKRKKRLNATEERALDHLQERLVTEWSVCNDINIEEARKELQSMLQNHQV
jgi:RNA polymerase-interacting CarD/CdnL/TRCF family regulator